MSTAPTPHPTGAREIGAREIGAREIGAREITELLAWCRRLSAAGPDADPAERAAYLTAKTDLLTRITGHPNHDHDRHGREEQR